MDALFAALPMIIFITIIVWMLVYQYMQHEKIKDELYKLVKQSGAHIISIESHWSESKTVYLFRLTYRDLNGKWQERQVSRRKRAFGQGQGEFMWDRPLINEPDAHLSSRLGSKEQIISDMDAEIKRLQQELEKSRKKS